MMKRFGKQVTRGPIRWLTRRELLAPLLVLAVLMCHGAYGAMHQVMADPSHVGVMSAPGYPVGEHSLSGAAHESFGQDSHESVLDQITALLFSMGAHSEGGAASGIVAGFGHVAALLLVSASAWLLLVTARRDEPLTRRLLEGTVRAPISLDRSVRPTLSRLQVLRL